MCGIAGIIGSQSHDLIDQMTAAIEHRGPDGAGLIRLRSTSGDEVSLGHRRLSIIDLSPTGAQPMTTDCQRCGHTSAHQQQRIWMVFNGEIYNFRELRSELAHAGHQFEGASDSEVLIHLYAEMGLEFLKRLNGIFALAIYDGRPKPAKGLQPGDILLARDPFGVKPLYYAEPPDTFVFCSEIKGMIPALKLRSVNLEAVACHLSLLFAPAPLTAMNEVKKFKPGHYAIVRDCRINQLKSFYEVPFDLKWIHSEKEPTAKILRTTFIEAVRRQMVADVPVGAFLSGGVDSTAIVAAMRHVSDADLTCFTIRDDGGGTETNSDLHFARLAAKRLQTKLIEVEVRPDDFFELSDLVYQLDEPIADPSAISTALISKSARQNGIKVLLAGTGGDDIFAGYSRHLASRWLEFEDRLPVAMRRWMRIGAEQIGLSGPNMPYWNDRNRRSWRIFSALDRPISHRIGSMMFSTPTPILRMLLNRDLAAIVQSSPRRLISQSIDSSCAQSSALNLMLFAEMKHFLADHNLIYFDKMSMSQGVEVRVPFLDKDLVHLSTQINPKLKLHGRTTKYILKAAVRSMIPDEIIDRPKRGFGLPIQRWFRDDWRSLAADILLSERVRQRGLYDCRSLEKILQDRRRLLQPELSLALLSMMMVELWLQRFVD